MKILLAPSKTRDCNAKMEYTLTIPKHTNEASYLVKKVNELSREKISKIMKIKNDLLVRTILEYEDFNESSTVPAIMSYKGIVYKEMNINNYTKEQIKYMQRSIRILSALYGVLKPLDKIKIARLDMNMKILEISNYKYWSKRIDDFLLKELKEEEIIINLSSKEFSKMVHINIIDIEFKEKQKNVYKTVAVYSKKARGKMAEFLITNLIDNMELIKTFDEDGYSFNEELSKKEKIVFTR